MNTQSLKTGFIGGLVGIFLSLMGIIESFHQKFIIHEIITMGEALLMLLVLFISYLAAKKSRTNNKTGILLNSTICGGIIGTMLYSLVMIGQTVDLRTVLVNASPGLYQILTFSMRLFNGVLLLLVSNILCGLLAGFLYILPKNFQKIITTSFLGILAAGILQDLIRPLLVLWDLNVTNQLCDHLFPAKNGLSLTSALCLFGLLFIVFSIRYYKGRKIKEMLNDHLPISQKSFSKLYTVGLFLVCLSLPIYINLYLCEVITIIGIYILLGLGLNIVVGYAGLLDLGYVAFFAIGAYTIALLTSEELGFFNLTFWQALPVSILLGIIAGVLLGIPVLKMRGDYLAIVTLGFGEILRILVRSDVLKPFLNGSHGIGNIPNASIGTWIIDTPGDNYYLILFCCMSSIFITRQLNHSRISRAWKAVREDEDVAQAMGINVVKVKLQAFAIGAGFSALGGAVFANKIGSVFPVSFSLIVSINIMCIIIVGGLGSVKGVIMGALIMVGLPELLREFGEFRYFFYGIALVLIMILKPEGLCPERNL